MAVFLPAIFLNRRNRGVRWSVQSRMLHGIAYLILSSMALGQAPQADVLDAAIQTFWKAKEDARFDDAITARDTARELLERKAPEEPRFGDWARSVSGLYTSSGMYARGREVLEGALSRTAALGDGHPARSALLLALAEWWQQDRNLLKAITYMEKVVEALEAVPAKGSIPRSAPGQSIGFPSARGYAPFRRSMGGGGASFAVGGDSSQAYRGLADLYLQAGRREAAARLVAKVRARAESNGSLVASLYERQGDLDEAAAIYRKQAEEAVNQQAGTSQATSALQSLARIYEYQQRSGDAIAALQQLVSILNTSGTPDARQTSILTRQNIADAFRRSGKIQAAEQTYQQLLSDTRGSGGSQVLVLTSYANFLGMTNRAAQGEDLLNEYRASHSLELYEEINVLNSLTNLAWRGDSKERADAYQKMAMQRQGNQNPAPPATLPRIAANLQRAEAVSDPDEAFGLAMQAMDSTSSNADLQQITWLVPAIASRLVGKKEYAKADQLYERMVRIAESWSGVTMEPAMTASQTYVHFLMQRSERWGDVPEAIERYRNALTKARGAGTGWLEDVLRTKIEFERRRNSYSAAILAANELLALVESSSGATSEPFLRAVETLADVYQSGDDAPRAIPLRRQAIAVSDAVFTASNSLRGRTRMTAAMLLATQGQFDEAERLAKEAIAMGDPRVPDTKMFAAQLEQILRMKANFQLGPPSANGVGNGVVGRREARPASRWFDPSAGPSPSPQPNAGKKQE